MKKIILMFALLYVPLFCMSQSKDTSSWSESGLEVSDSKTIPIWIQDIDQNTKNIGLTYERIKTKCEFKIRQMNLKPVDFLSTVPLQPYELMVSVQANKQSFFIDLQFVRTVSYKVDSHMYGMYATTWGTNGFGSHDNDPEYILSALDGEIEKFLNAFVKANSH